MDRKIGEIFKNAKLEVGGWGAGQVMVEVELGVHRWCGVTIAIGLDKIFFT